jgi:hypothetical protein
MLHAPLSAGACRVAAALLTVSLMPAAVYGACAAGSGPATTALVELYTALACDACLEADRWLADLAPRYAPRSVVPLSFHVRDGDYTNGGRSTDQVRRRERRLSPRQRLALAYTPRVLLQGKDFPEWRGARFDRAVRQRVALPSRAHVALAILGSSDAALRVRVEATRPDAAPGSVYVTAFEQRASGPTAFAWIGPFGLGRQEMELPLLPGASPAASGVAGFVQDGRTGEVLQALILGPCVP